MDYEKKYNEALERAKAAIDVAADRDLVKGVAITIFPELRESEDERIINQLITLVNSTGEVLLIPTNKEELVAWLNKCKESLHISETCKENADSFTDEDERIRRKMIEHFKSKTKETWCNMPVKSIISYLEKQKEQKPSIEICPHSIKSKSYKENGYPIEDCDYGLEIAFDILEKTFGEVRGYQTDDGIREHQTAIEAVRKAKEQKPDEAEAFFASSESYAQGFVAGQKKMKKDIEKGFGISEHSLDYLAGRYAGYSAAKEEEQKPVEPSGKLSREEYLYQLLIDQLITYSDYEYLTEQKPAEWSENDTVFLNEIIDFFENKTVKLQHDLDMYAHWLKSLPERFVLQPKQEWSEEDEKMKERLITRLNWITYNTRTDGTSPNITFFDEIDWLKSLRPQQKQEIYLAAKHDMAIKFMNYLDENRPEGMMGLSNAECEDIDKAFKENDWAKIVRYIEKYQPHWKPSEEQMEALKCAIADVAKFSKRGGRQVELENEPYYSALHSLYCNLEKLM